MKLLITNLVYGSLYSDIFLNYHLKSLLDETNIPSHIDNVEYLIFTDEETAPKITEHPNVKRMGTYLKVEVEVFTWPIDVKSHYSARYSMQVLFFKKAVEEALRRSAILSSLAADLVVAKDFLTKLFTRFEAGYKAILSIPMRSAFESSSLYLNQFDGALTPQNLFTLAYNNPHPLWVASHFESAQFSRLPYTLLWNNGAGLLARSFTISPIAFLPTPQMLEVNQVMDVGLPPLLESPYFAKDWEECPIIGIEPLACHYPPFSNKQASIQRLTKWTKDSEFTEAQYDNLKRTFYFPNEEAWKDSTFTEIKADEVVNALLESANQKC